MARTKTPIRSARRRARPSGHELVLAGIGAVSLARKQAGKAFLALVAEGSKVRARLAGTGERMRGEVMRRADAVLEAVAPIARDLRRQADRSAAALGKRRVARPAAKTSRRKAPARRRRAA
jgi:hypothetical protein